MNTVRRTGSCVHLDVYKRTHGVGSNSPYSSIHTMFVTCLARGSLEMKAKFGQCQECDNRRGRLHACLHCVFFGCFTNGHMVRHFETTGHIISMDMKFGNVFCHECNDYMYDAKFEDVSKKWKEMEDKRSAAIERQQSAAGGSGVVRSVYASSIGNADGHLPESTSSTTGPIPSRDVEPSKSAETSNFTSDAVQKCQPIPVLRRSTRVRRPLEKLTYS